MKIKIFNPKEGMQGNDKNNIFIVMDEAGNYLGNGYVFEKISEQLTPKHPINIFIDVSLEEQYLYHQIGFELFRLLYKRANELFEQSNYDTGLLYYGTEIKDEKFHFFRDQGLTSDINSYQMSRSTDIIRSDGLAYAILEDMDHYEDIIRFHNDVLIKPIDDSLIHQFSHKDNFKCITVKDNDNLIASMMIYSEEQHGIIDHLIVHSDYKRQGIGKYLMSAAMSHFHKNFISTATLEVWSANRIAMAFYEAIGFKVQKETEYYVGVLLGKKYKQ
ncbi:MAG: GNAT family N-acetyltransferase [Clostridiales bacterium]|nr:GNAT family N-acetyltransferase [Clostridiales bacterium]